MLTYLEDGQACLFDLVIYAGKMSPAHSPADRQRGKTSGSSSKKSSELSSIPYMFLDLSEDAGNLLGESYWETLSPWRGDALMLNTGPAPRNAENVYSLWQILEEQPHSKYYLTRKACQGILRRSRERGKLLPPQLEDALAIQAGDKPVEKNGDASSEHAVGYDPHNGDISGDVSPTLGINCGVSTGRNGILNLTAFTQNQRDEVRDLHDVSATVCASPGTKQQTFLVAGVVKEPHTICLDDQGGQFMSCSENIAGTLRAQMNGHPPILLESNQKHATVRTDGISTTLPASMGMGGGYVPMVYENHGIDSRYNGPLEVAPTMSARYGTGSNNVPLVEQPPETFCIVGNIIDRQPGNGGNGLGCQTVLQYLVWTL